VRIVANHKIILWLRWAGDLRLQVIQWANPKNTKLMMINSHWYLAKNDNVDSIEPPRPSGMTSTGSSHDRQAKVAVTIVKIWLNFSFQAAIIFLQCYFIILIIL